MMHDQAFFYVVPFLCSVVISVCVCLCVIFFFHFRRVPDNRRGARHCHTKNIARFGGVAMIVAFVCSLYINHALVLDRPLWAIIFGSIAILIFGIVDDLRPLSWRVQLVFQIMLVLGTFFAGVHMTYVSNPFGGVLWLFTGQMTFVGVLFMIAWMIFIMNAINWCDGIDGLASGVVCIAAITLFFIALQPHVMQPPIAIIAMVLAGSTVGFLLFNFPPARIFAGTSGSFFMGYVIAVLAIVAGAKIGATLLVLAVPLLDAVWVIIHRVRNHTSIFHSDTTHLHHRLRAMGWSVTQIVLLYYGITTLCAIAAIFTQSINKLFIFIVLSVGIILFFVRTSRRGARGQ